MAIRPATTTIFMTGKGSRPSAGGRAQSKVGLATRGLTRRALPTVVTLLAVAVFVLAGNWQRDRMQQKLVLGEQLAAATAAAVVPLPVGDVDWSQWRFRVVETQGR